MQYIKNFISCVCQRLLLFSDQKLIISHAVSWIWK